MVDGRSNLGQQIDSLVSMALLTTTHPVRGVYIAHDFWDLNLRIKD